MFGFELPSLLKPSPLKTFILGVAIGILLVLTLT